VVETWNQSLDRTAQEIAGVGFAIALALAITTVGFDLSNVAIIAGAHEGYVRRIDVRATEIETFRRAAVIVPNSELISGAVINWTHKNRYGRVELPVGVAYGSDVAQVMEILQRCLKEHESILRIAIYLAFEEAGIEIPFPQRDLHIKNVENVDEGFRARTAQLAPQPPPQPPPPPESAPTPAGMGNRRGESSEPDYATAAMRWACWIFASPGVKLIPKVLRNDPIEIVREKDRHGPGGIA